MSVHRGAFPSCRNFLIPKEFQSCIIGKEGKTIQGIQITTGTHIKIKDNKDPQKCMVSITGRANSTRAAEKKIRQVIDEHTKSAKRQQETKEINDWKKSLGFNSGDGILLKVCSEFKNGKCNLTETECSLVHPESGTRISGGYIMICYNYLIDYCERSMTECPCAHRSKDFIETKLKTQGEKKYVDGIKANTANKSTQTKNQKVNSARILALEKQIIELEKALHAKEIMIEEFLTDPVQFI